MMSRAGRSLGTTPSSAVSPAGKRSVGSSNTQKDVQKSSPVTPTRATNPVVNAVGDATLLATAAAPSGQSPQRQHSPVASTPTAVKPKDGAFALVGEHSPNPRSSQHPPSFVELIRARELQQMRIRNSLEQQNDQLQQRLKNAFDSRETSVNINEFLMFVTEVKELVVRGNEAEVAAFKALNDKVEQQERFFEGRIAELEARLIASDRTRDLVREEQMDQILSLSNEVETLKEASERLETQVAAHADANDQTVVFSERVAAALQDIEERVVSIESLPTTVTDTLADMEVRLNQVQLDVQEDLRKIRERYPDTEDKLAHVMSKAEENLLLLQRHADSSIMAAEYQQKRIEELIESGIANMGRALEGMMTAKYYEHVTKLTEDHERTMLKVQTQEDSLMEAVVGLKKQVDDYLSNLDAAHNDSVDRAMSTLHERADAFEAERRQRYPTAEPERIALMLEELEGAFSAVEGIVRAHLTNGINIDHPYVRRLETLESQMAYINGTLGDTEGGPRIVFSTETQTAIGASQEGGAFGESTAARLRQQLDSEVAIAKTEQTADVIAKTVDLIVARANSRPATPRGRVGTPTANPTPRDPIMHTQSNLNNTFGGASAYSDAHARSRSDSNSFNSLPPATQAVDRFTTNEDIRKKEETVERIQGALKEIAIKFKDISDREAAAERNGSLGDEGARQLVAVISKQKGAIYEKERQLLEMRNNLLREIKELKGKL